MFPQPEMNGAFSLVNNSDFILNNFSEKETSNSSTISTNGANSTGWNPDYPYKPSVSPQIQPGIIYPSTETIIVYPPLPLEGTMVFPPDVYPDNDSEIVVLPKDPMKKKEALRELLKDKVEEPEEREGRRIDLGEED